jgi:hypothetical protein
MISYLKDCVPESLQGYPYCIIGSGAAGVSLAIALLRKGHRVLLIDGGDWHEDASLDDAYIGHADAPHPATTEYRRQRFGGTTHLWGGRCVPLDAVDLNVRAHVPNSGWPIELQEIEDYYPEAMSYCDAGVADFTINALAGNVAPMFDELPSLQAHLQERIERYSLPTDFSKKYKNELSSSKLAQVLLRARCTKLNLIDQDNKVNSIEVTDGLQKFEINAANFILCGGGIETTRLLLSTRAHAPNWVRFDPALGKFYGCHYELIFGDLSFSGKKPFFDFQKTKDGVYARRKLQFSQAFQAEHGLLNSVFRLHFPAYADAGHGSGVLSTIYLAKSILASEHQSILNHGVSSGNKINNSSLAHIKNVATDIGSVFSFGYDYIFKMKLAERRLPYTLVPNRNGSYPLEFNSEQVPDASNKVTLLDQLDAQGVQRVSVHWKLTETDIASGVESFIQLQRLLATTQACKLAFDYGELKERISGALPVGGHHIGTTKMGHSAQNSVVDKNCQLHGVANLFVASASVFPTNSHANPTLTIIALALRLANYLDRTMVVH